LSMFYAATLPMFAEWRSTTLPALARAAHLTDLKMSQKVKKGKKVKSDNALKNVYG
jgi:hypothetical protein